MPSSPKIPKEKILQTALNLIIRDGYDAVNIKTVAKELGCSTQPVSWHFGNMEGFRKALAEYALNYANSKLLSITESGIYTFLNMGIGYIEIAFEEPNLFCYLYMNGGSGFQFGHISMLSDTGASAIIAQKIADQLNMSRKEVSSYVRDIIIYTHGLACFIASGLISTPKEEVIEMIKNVAYTMFGDRLKGGNQII